MTRLEAPAKMPSLDRQPRKMDMFLMCDDTLTSCIPNKRYVLLVYKYVINNLKNCVISKEIGRLYRCVIGHKIRSMNNPRMSLPEIDNIGLAIRRIENAPE